MLCNAAGETVTLLAIRSVVLKILNNDPVPDFFNLCQALRTGLIDVQLITTQNSRAHASILSQRSQRGSPRPNLHNPGSRGNPYAGTGYSSGNTLHGSVYYPKYLGPMLLFPSTLFYTLQRMVHGFPYMLVASKGRNVVNVPVSLNQEEIDLLNMRDDTRLYLFSGLSSTPNPAKTDILFPPIEIHVDGINTKQYVKGLKGKPGTCRPADITDHVKNLSRQFIINIVYSDAPEPYIMYLYIVNVRSPQKLVDYISKECPHISTQATLAAIKQDYEQNLDEDIIMDKSLLSLRCPITYARMKYPMKSTVCDHVQCFDGLSFLQMQERIPSWICPVCSAQLDQNTLAISNYMTEIIDNTHEDVDTVNLNFDGSWEVKKEEEDEQPPQKQQQKSPSSAPAQASSEPPAASVDDAIEIVSIDSESDEEEVPQPPPLHSPEEPSAQPQSAQSSPSTQDAQPASLAQNAPPVQPSPPQNQQSQPSQAYPPLQPPQQNVTSQPQTESTQYYTQAVPQATPAQVQPELRPTTEQSVQTSPQLRQNGPQMSLNFPPIHNYQRQPQARPASQQLYPQLPSQEQLASYAKKQPLQPPILQYYYYNPLTPPMPQFGDKNKQTPWKYGNPMPQVQKLPVQVGQTQQQNHTLYGPVPSVQNVYVQNIQRPAVNSVSFLHSVPSQAAPSTLPTNPPAVANSAASGPERPDLGDSEDEPLANRRDRPQHRHNPVVDDDDSDVTENRSAASRKLPQVCREPLDSSVSVINTIQRQFSRSVSPEETQNSERPQNGLSGSNAASNLNSEKAPTNGHVPQHANSYSQPPLRAVETPHRLLLLGDTPNASKPSQTSNTERYRQLVQSSSQMINRYNQMVLENPRKLPQEQYAQPAANPPAPQAQLNIEPLASQSPQAASVPIPPVNPPQDTPNRSPQLPQAQTENRSETEKVAEGVPKRTILQQPEEDDSIMVIDVDETQEKATQEPEQSENNATENENEEGRDVPMEAPEESSAQRESPEKEHSEIQKEAPKDVHEGSEPQETSTEGETRENQQEPQGSKEVQKSAEPQESRSEIARHSPEERPTEDSRQSPEIARPASSEERPQQPEHPPQQLPKRTQENTETSKEPLDPTKSTPRRVFSPTAFDVLQDDAPEKTKGLLGIEIASNVWKAKEQQNAQPILPMNERIQNMSIETPALKKRPVPTTERTWNKRLSRPKEKFEPSEVNALQIIELDD